MIQNDRFDPIDNVALFDQISMELKMAPPLVPPAINTQSKIPVAAGAILAWFIVYDDQLEVLEKTEIEGDAVPQPAFVQPPAKTA